MHKKKNLFSTKRPRQMQVKMHTFMIAQLN